MTARSPATANADYVRGAFPAKHDYYRYEHLPLCRRCALDNALDEIVALAERAIELEAELASWKDTATHAGSRVRELEGQKVAAEARATELERELSEEIDRATENGRLAQREYERAVRAETALRERDTLIARQLTPLDVAVTHIQIIRRKGDEYSEQERDNVAAIVEQHIAEARMTMFAALNEGRE